MSQYRHIVSINQSLIMINKSQQSGDVSLLMNNQAVQPTSRVMTTIPEHSRLLAEWMRTRSWRRPYEYALLRTHITKRNSLLWSRSVPSLHITYNNTQKSQLFLSNFDDLFFLTDIIITAISRIRGVVNFFLMSSIFSRAKWGAGVHNKVWSHYDIVL